MVKSLTNFLNQNKLQTWTQNNIFHYPQTNKLTPKQTEFFKLPKEYESKLQNFWKQNNCPQTK